ncbi:MAG TPA: hypothetical protein ENI07_22180 [Desulfobacterales bacterium]|nr:hypothetical protein [Desulfobacterales bacterium]
MSRFAISRIESDFSYDLSFLCHSISRRRGYDIRTVQEPLVHNNVKTTMISTHVLNRGPVGFRSPVNELNNLTLIEHKFE